MQFLSVALYFSTAAHAVPAQFTHQGRLLNAEGLPVEGSATLTFRVATSETGGDILWQETLAVSLNNGFYSAILGAEEDTNPLDTEVLSQAPVWLELQLSGSPPMVPRNPILSVPYATMAGVAEELSGGPVDASSISIGGVPVVSDAGEWIGTPPTIRWGAIIDKPPGFADGVDDEGDALATLGMSCLDGDVPVWDATLGLWTCDEDQDTLARLACADGQLPRWSEMTSTWECADDAVLSEVEVDAMVADNGYLTEEDLAGSGRGGTVIYTRCAWTGATMPTTGACTPPSCPDTWEDLGITGNVKATMDAYGSADYASTYSESGGFQERGCYQSNPVAVLVTRCPWSGDTAPAIGSCTPPVCPDTWTDLGVTGNVKSSMGMWGSADYATPYSESGGYQERTCVK